VVHIAKGGALKAGDWADVTITGSDAHDLRGVLVKDQTQLLGSPSAQRTQ